MHFCDWHAVLCVLHLMRCEAVSGSVCHTLHMAQCEGQLLLLSLLHSLSSQIHTLRELAYQVLRLCVQLA